MQAGRERPDPTCSGVKPTVAESGRDLAWTAGGEGQQDRENDNADAVVEE